MTSTSLQVRCTSNVWEDCMSCRSVHYFSPRQTFMLAPVGSGSRSSVITVMFCDA